MLKRLLRFGCIGAMAGLLIQIVWGHMDNWLHTLGTSFCIGVCLALVDHYLLSKAARRLPYGWLLILRAITYFCIIFAVMYADLLFYLKGNGWDTSILADKGQLKQIKQEYLLTNVNILYILAIALFLSFFGQLQSFFGKGVIYNYLIGRYHKPSIQERIFMFLDLNDATTIAEKLGPQKYSALLRNFFSDIDYAFVSNRGHVHQYVGDEIVVIWNAAQGLRSDRCILAFIHAQQRLLSKKDLYLKDFAVFPQFKGAIHIGPVSITEIGVSKKEIAYHGDAINTTARICGMAHTLNRHLLISESLYARLSPDTQSKFERMGDYHLKGKVEETIIYGIDQS